MFYDCSGLVVAPALPATTLATDCYKEMFAMADYRGVLNQIEVHFTDWGSGFVDWVFQVADTGTFIKPDALTAIYDIKHIPVGWTTATLMSVNTIPTIQFTSSDSGTPVASSIVSYINYDGSDQNFKYSVEGTLPQGVTFRNGVFTCIPSAIAQETVNINLKIKSTDRGSVVAPITIKCVNLTTPITFKSTGDTTLRLSTIGSPTSVTLQYKKNTGEWTNYTVGNTISLSNGDTVAFSGSTETFSNSESNYYRFTGEGTGSVIVYGNIMSLVNYKNSVGSFMFRGLFNEFTILTNASDLILPVTTLAEYCYKSMFYSCTNLLVAPNLPATTLANGCYAYMFQGCTNLTQISVDFPDWDTSYTTNWVYHVAATGTFYKPSSLIVWVKNNDAFPAGWTGVDK